MRELDEKRDCSWSENDNVKNVHFELSQSFDIP